ncbi:hypothetical protein BBK36DRAFT_1131020, partial [Trichoderma citrinoviride]
MPDSEWKPQPDDETIYGIKATGAPTQFLVSVPLKAVDNRDVLPDVGTRVRIYTPLPQEFHVLPARPLTVTQVDSMTRALCQALSLAENKAYNCRRAEELKRAASQASQDDDYSDPEEEELESLDDIATSAYLQAAAPKVLSYVAAFSEEADAVLPDAEESVKRYFDALKTAHTLRKTDDEKDVDHQRRIHSWMSKQTVVCRTTLDQKRGQPLPGLRIPLPSGTLADVAIFVVSAPSQPNWPYGFRQPPLTIDVRQKSFPANLSAYWQNLAAAAGKTMVRIDYDVDDKTCMLECAAVAELNALAEESEATAWWNHLVSFSPHVTPPAYDLTQRFTGLGDAIDSGLFKGQHAEAVECLRRARMGRAFYTGGPGSGKSTFAVSLVTAILAGKQRTVEPVPRPESHMEATMHEFGRKGDLLVDYIAPTPPEDTVDEDDTQQPPDDEFSSGPQEPLVGTDWLAPEGQLEDLGPILWTAPQNAQVKDAVHRLQQQAPNKLVVRVYPFDQELRALLAAEPRQPEVSPVPTNAAKSATQLITHLNEYRRLLWADHCPEQDPMSVSSQLRNLIGNDETVCPDIAEGWRTQVSDLAAFIVNKKDYLEKARLLISDFVSSAHVIAGTPVALKMLANHVRFQPSFIVIDEAGRMSENMCVMPISSYPTTPAIWMGDNQQFGPRAAADQDREYKPLFTQQRRRSLLRRVEGAGQIDFTLSIN